MRIAQKQFRRPATRRPPVLSLSYNALTGGGALCMPQSRDSLGSRYQGAVLRVVKKIRRRSGRRREASAESQKGVKTSSGAGIERQALLNRREQAVGDDRFAEG